MKVNANKAVWVTDRTRYKVVSGGFMINGRIYNRPISVRVTKDKHGESMSLSDDDNEIMLHIPLEAVRDMLQIVDGEREENEKKGTEKEQKMTDSEITSKYAGKVPASYKRGYKDGFYDAVNEIKDLLYDNIEVSIEFYDDYTYIAVLSVLSEIANKADDMMKG